MRAISVRAAPIGLTGCLLLVAGEPSRAQIPSAVADLTSRVERVIGTSPADCGRIFINKENDPAVLDGWRKAIACVEEHAAKRTPAWTFELGFALDSFDARGFLVGRDGQIQRFDYDSDPAGGGIGVSRFTFYTCYSPTVEAGDNWRPKVTCGYPRSFNSERRQRIHARRPTRG